MLRDGAFVNTLRKRGGVAAPGACPAAAHPDRRSGFSPADRGAHLGSVRHLGSMGWPYFNWILEHVEEARRPLYIGMSNTLSAAVMLAPTVGGWVVGAASFQASFALALACVLTALGLSVGLPSTRRRG